MNISAQSGSYPHVQQPLQINGIHVRNRVARTAHVTGFPDGTITQRHIDYQVRRAQGGFGLLILEYAGVHPTSPTDIHAFRDETIAGWARLADAVHAHDARVFQQLWHGGAQGPGGRNPASRSVSRPGLDWAPSAVPDIRGRVPIPMTKANIEEVVEAFGAAARRCERAGLDGVELHGGHGYLICQFLSPLTNRREDEYGGDLTNRLRFATEALRAARASVSAGFPVGIRLSATESAPGGITVDDTKRIARMLQDEALIDFVDISLGSFRAPTFNLAMEADAGYELLTSAPVAEVLQVPTIVTGRFTRLSDVEDVLARGVSDMVAMTRASIADPDLVVKSLAGREDEVRPCIGCNEGCLGRRLVSTVVECAVNVHVGFEGASAVYYPPAQRARKVLVVGAGPAGLHAARAARLRGHEVSVYEIRDFAGGHAEIARRAPHRRDFGNVTDWLQRELKRLDVPVHLSSPVDMEVVRELAPDVVVVATGAEPLRDAVQRCVPQLAPLKPGSEGRVVTAVDVLEGRSPRPDRALVLDDLGTYPAVGAAEFLLELGSEVTFATSQASFAPDLALTFQQEPAARRLTAAPGYAFAARAALASFDGQHAVVRNLDSGAETILDVDLVVLALAYAARRSLFDELATAGADARLTGDALSTDKLQQAMMSGYQVALSI